MPASCALAVASIVGGASAQTPPRPAPIFVPGLYATESRNSAFRNEGTTSIRCIASADYESFRRETIRDYLRLPQFASVCRLSDTREIADGFAFAMDCVGSQTILAFHFSPNVVGSSARTSVAARPEYSSTLLTLSRRIGACPNDRGLP